MENKEPVENALESLVRKHTGEAWMPVRDAKNYLQFLRDKQEDGIVLMTRYLLKEELDFCEASGMLAKGSIAEFCT
jgi:hypothetical protein